MPRTPQARWPTEKPVPYDRDAERAVLGSLMVDPEAMDRIDALVGAGDFMPGTGHGEIFGVCRALWRDSEEINQITVAHALSRTNQLEVAGGIPGLADLVGELPTPVGVEHYAQIVRRDARYRKAIILFSQSVEDAYEGGADVDAFVERCEKRMMSLHDEGSSDFVRMDDEIDAYMEEPGVLSRTTRMARTGLMDLDGILLGLNPGTLTIVAAQTSIGKSVLLQNIGRNTLLGQNFRVAVLSLEMSRREWMNRMVACETGVSITRLAGGFEGLSDDEQRSVMEARTLLDAMPLHIDDRPRLTVESMRATLRKHRAMLDGLDLVIVDYLQLMGASRNFESRHLEIGHITRGLKLLAKELDVPFVVAAQLSREIDKRAIQRTRTKGDRPTTMTLPARPRLSDLRESGSIEQDADVVMFMYRKDKAMSQTEWDAYYASEPKKPKYPAGMVEVIVAKNRNGKTGYCTVRMHDALARIEDLQAEAQEMVTPEQFR